MYRADEWEFRITPTPSASFSPRSPANQGKIVLPRGKNKPLCISKGTVLPQSLFSRREQPLRS